MVQYGPYSVQFTTDVCNAMNVPVDTTCDVVCSGANHILIGSQSVKCDASGKWTFEKRPCCVGESLNLKVKQKLISLADLS